MRVRDIGMDGGHKMNRKITSILSAISPLLTTKLMFQYNFHRKLDLKNPQNLNEKFQWLKLYAYYDNPVITTCVDKLKVKDYLSERGYKDLLPQIYGMGGYEDAEEIRKHWSEYPDSFVIKCNHGSGYNILIKDKKSTSLDEIIKKLNIWVKEDYWKKYCEPQYKNVPHKILVEEYLGDDIHTYKFYCFNGKPRVAYISSNGENGEYDKYYDYFDMEWNWLPITLYPHQNSKIHPEKPKKLDEMIAIARDLSKEFPFVRVDLYNIDGVIKFSELTFIPTGGNMKLTPENVIDEWGGWLKLPMK